MEQTVSVSVGEARQRWQEIVRALVERGIGPDVVTFAALTMGIQTLAANLGVTDMATPKRPIGFNPRRQQQ